MTLNNNDKSKEANATETGGRKMAVSGRKRSRNSGNGEDPEHPTVSLIQLTASPDG